MSYESPIEIVKTMHDRIEHDIENNVFKLINSYGININKDELIKALKYDRHQYEKGYTEGYNQGIKDAISKLKEHAVEEHFMRTEYIIDEDTLDKLLEEYSK